MTDERALADVALVGLSASDTIAIEWPPVARRVRETRERLGLTADMIASRLGIAQSEYQDIEFHDAEAFTSFSVAHLGQLAVILGMPLEKVLFGPNSERPNTRTPFAAIAQRLSKLARSEGLTIEQLSQRVGWDLAPVLSNPELLGQLNVVGLRDVCTAVGVDWVSVLPEIEETDRPTSAST